MVDYYIYAWDSYSSIFENEDGNFKGLETMVNFFKDVAKIKEEQLVVGQPLKQPRFIFLHWSQDFSGASGDQTILEDRSCIRKWVEKEPEWIIRCLKDKYVVDANDRIKLLYIMADGMMGNIHRKKCMKLNKDMHYEKVVFHAFNKDLAKVDLSAAAPFFKSHCIVYRNDELCYSADISKEFDYDGINADNFAAERDQLKSYIKLKYINKCRPDAGVWQEIKKLTVLRDRLLQELSLKPGKYIFSTGSLKATERNLLTAKTGATDFWKVFNATIVIRTDVNESFAAMLEYIKSGKKSYSFDALKFNTKVDNPVAVEPMDDADSTDDDAGSTDNDADSTDNDADSIDDDADSTDNDADSMDDDADSTDDDADSMDDDADSMDEDTDSTDDDDDSKAKKEMKFLDILLEHKEGISIWNKYIDIMY